MFIRTSFTFTLMTTETFGRNIGKLFSKLKLVTGNLFNYAETNEESLKVYLCDF